MVTLGSAKVGGVYIFYTHARDHLDLEDTAWNTQPYPNVTGRQAFGNIAIANSDAGADAYTHIAFDQAWRAVQELP